MKSLKEIMDYKNLPAGKNLPHVVNAVIEIPCGSSNKYEFDVDLKVFKLDRVLYSPVHYPADYGFIPNTLADDGDPLDILVLISNPTFTGCVLEARPVCMLEMRDDKGVDEKVLAVAQNDPRFAGFNDLKDVAAHVLKEIEHFFTVYKSLEGRMSATYGWTDKNSAHERIQKYLLKN